MGFGVAAAVAPVVEVFASDVSAVGVTTVDATVVTAATVGVFVVDDVDEPLLFWWWVFSFILLLEVVLVRPVGVDAGVLT